MGEDAGRILAYSRLMQYATSLGSACRRGQWDSRFSYATIAERGSEYAKHSGRVMDYRLDSVWHLLGFEMSWTAGLLEYRLGVPTWTTDLILSGTSSDSDELDHKALDYRRGLSRLRARKPFPSWAIFGRAGLNPSDLLTVGRAGLDFFSQPRAQGNTPRFLWRRNSGKA